MADIEDDAFLDYLYERGYDDKTIAYQGGKLIALSEDGDDERISNGYQGWRYNTARP